MESASTGTEATEGHGFDVQFLGASVAVETLSCIMAKHRPQLAGLSVTLAGPAALLVLAVLLATPAAAQATIVPQQGMKGARLGMTVAQVRDRIGEPSRSAIVKHEIIGRVRELRYGLTVMTFSGTTDDAELNTISTTSRSERLSNGIGIGSTRAAVDRKVARTRCAVEFGFDHCYIGSFRPGRTVTDFHISKAGRVKRIVVGIVID